MGGRKTVVLASILKPVNDTRMYEKFARTLAKDVTLEVHVVGFPIKATTLPGVTTHALPQFKRLSLQRLFAPWKVLKVLLALKPSLLIITTHELLFVSLIAKLLCGTKVIYDIQENYFRNILFTPGFPVVLRPILALYVRSTELISAPFISHFILAEIAYRDEMKFLPNRVTIIENRAIPSATPVVRDKTNIRLLFSGTLAETTGIFIAIDIAKKIFSVRRDTALTIIGYCARANVLKKIREEIDGLPYIKLIGGEELVDHSLIMEEIHKANLGIVSYPPNHSTKDAIPTKLFEYIAAKLPMLLIDNSRWIEFCAPYPAAIVFQQHDVDAPTIIKAFENTAFYQQQPVGITWQDVQPHLEALILRFI